MNDNFIVIAPIVLILIHFGVPLIYYFYATTKWLPKPWGINIDPRYEPSVSIILPTYNESDLIYNKLNNLHEQAYPREKLEIIVVDSASTDNTLNLVRKWTKLHPDINLKIIEESERKGKAFAMNKALNHITGNIVIITDADAWWPSKTTIKEVTKWFADPIVGAISCLKTPAEGSRGGVEKNYRNYYNMLRLAESKAWATPIFHGELGAFRKSILEKIGRFPLDIGSDDSHAATRIVLIGYRAIIPEDLLCVEKVPKKGYHIWRIRRAQHLIQHFLKIFRLKLETPKEFKKIVYVETFLHLFNPWVFLILTIYLLILTFMGSPVTTFILSIGILLLLYRSYRMWIFSQFYLIIATIRNFWKKEIIWEKQNK